MYSQFQHPYRGELQRDQFIWSLSSIPLLEGYLHVLDGEPLKDVVEALIHQYKTSVIPKRRCFHRCECHIHAFCSLSCLLLLSCRQHSLALCLKSPPYPRFCTCFFACHPPKTDFVHRFCSCTLLMCCASFGIRSNPR